LEADMRVTMMVWDGVGTLSRGYGWIAARSGRADLEPTPSSTGSAVKIHP
jgi:hypothetical protein